MPRFGPHPVRRPVLIAGASSGIGAATAQLLGAAGYPVALGARRVEKCQETAEQISAAGGEAVAVPLDVTDTASVLEAVAKSQAALGALEVVISGAGDLAVGRAHEMDSAAWAEQIDIHLVGAHRLYRAAVPDMITRRRGDFIFIGSDVAIRPRPWSSAYVAAKTGIEGLVATAQMELEGTGVRASVIRPGQTLTGMGMNLDPTETEAMLGDWVRFGLARHGNFMTPDNVAQAVSSVIAMPPGAHIRVLEVEAEGKLTTIEEERR
ncbi:SDR family oxidoreductase [Gordonia sp. CPCC 205333]|uniref:SDR family oxidoreductase n=1 Tax=Gordonia sp. CPCC 205333 TaxID=3140790 RepID=UPI003AF37480